MVDFKGSRDSPNDSDLGAMPERWPKSGFRYEPVASPTDDANFLCRFLLVM